MPVKFHNIFLQLLCIKNWLIVKL